MKLAEGRLFTASLATMAAAFTSPFAAAAEAAVAAQELLNVRAAGQVTASWSRQSDYYALQVVMETSRPGPPRAITPARLDPEEMRQRGMADVAQTLGDLVPPNVAAASAGMAGGVAPERRSFFIGNTIANLRGLDPVFGCRTLTLVDGRRVVGGPPAARSSPASSGPYPYGVVQPYPPAIKHPRIEAWLLRADGTQAVPAAYTCTVLPAATQASAESSSASRSQADEFSYRYAVEDGAQAVAVAIRIDGDFFIEKLQPAQPAAQ